MRDGQNAEWRITLECRCDDGESDDTTKLELNNKWRYGSREMIECLAIDLGVILKMLLVSGHVLANGDPESALTEGLRE